MKIACVIQTMRMGGAQRVFAHMAEYWVENGVEVTLFLFSGDEPAYVPYSDKVKTISLDILGEVNGSLLQDIGKNLKRFPKLRKAIESERPDCVLGFMIDENLVTAISMMGSSIPFGLVEHSPFFFPVGRIKTALRDLLYPRASMVVSLTHKAKACFHPGIRSKTRVIHNPVCVPAHAMVEISEHGVASSGGVIVGLGRLANQKRFDRLIRAFQLVHSTCPGWRLKIVGEGEELDSLQRLIDKLNLSDVVSLPGGVPEPWNELKQADIFVLSSDSEGFPMALMEAMSIGLPVVSTDCQTGPAEMIVPYENGLLVDCDDRALAEAIIELIYDEDLRRKLSHAAISIGQKYSVERVMKRYTAVVDSVVLEKTKKNV